MFKENNIFFFLEISTMLWWKNSVWYWFCVFCIYIDIACVEWFKNFFLWFLFLTSFTNDGNSFLFFSKIKFSGSGPLVSFFFICVYICVCIVMYFFGKWGSVHIRIAFKKKSKSHTQCARMFYTTNSHDDGYYCIQYIQETCGIWI